MSRGHSWKMFAIYPPHIFFIRGARSGRGPLQATSWHFANIPDHLYTGKRTKMNKTSPVGAFISAANPFSGRFQVFNFQYEPRRARGRFLARFTYLNRISIQGNELELASFPNFAATLTVFTKTAHVKEGIHTPSSLKKKFFVFHAGVRYIAEYPAGLNAQTFL